MTPPRTVVAVTGATGPLGRALVRRLAGAGRVRMLAASSDGRTAWCERAGIEVIGGRIQDAPAVARLVDGVARVYHCAAIVGGHGRDRGPATEEAAVECVARAAAVAGVGRCLYVSSVEVYGATWCPENTITERVTPANTHRLPPLARSAYHGERRLQAIAAESDMAFTIIRPTIVYGPGTGWPFERYALLRALASIGLGQVPVDVVHVDDVVDAILLAAGSRIGANQVFHVGNEMVPLHVFIATVTRRRVRRLPRVVDRGVSTLLEGACRAMKGTCLPVSLRRAVSYPHLNAWVQLGYEPRVSLADTCRGSAAPGAAHGGSTAVPNPHDARVAGGAA